MMKKSFLGIIMMLALKSGAFAAPHAFPVPYVEREHGSDIHFTELPGAGTIKIYTITGDHVITLPIGTGQLSRDWEGVKNSDGKKVATGVYIYLIEGAGQKTEGKLVIIR